MLGRGGSKFVTPASRGRDGEAQAGDFTALKILPAITLRAFSKIVSCFWSSVIDSDIG